MKHDTKNLYTLLPLQSKEGQFYLKKYNLSPCDFDTVILIQNYEVYTASTAALMLIKNLSGIIRHFHFLIIIPQFIRDFIYNLIAKNRLTLFGKSKVCKIPKN